MSKFLKVEHLVVLGAIVINVVLAVMFVQVRKQLQLTQISALSNYKKLQYRVVDNIRISKKSIDDNFFKPKILLTMQGKELNFYDLPNGYYVLINYLGCNDCIEGAMAAIKGQNFKELRFIGGNFESLNSLKIFMSKNNINMENGYYCSDFSLSYISKEDAPIIFHLVNGKIANCCVIDGSFPVEYYKYFMSE